MTPSTVCLEQCVNNLSKAESRSRGKYEKEVHSNLSQKSTTSFRKINNYCLYLDKEMIMKTFTRVVNKFNHQNKLETCQNFVLECLNFKSSSIIVLSTLINTLQFFSFVSSAFTHFWRILCCYPYFLATEAYKYANVSSYQVLIFFINYYLVNH